MGGGRGDQSAIGEAWGASAACRPSPVTDSQAGNQNLAASVAPADATEPLLADNEDRFVLFPIRWGACPAALAAAPARPCTSCS